MSKGVTGSGGMMMLGVSKATKQKMWSLPQAPEVMWHVDMSKDAPLSLHNPLG
jgi:hypothetical protein